MESHDEFEIVLGRIPVTGGILMSGGAVLFLDFRLIRDERRIDQAALRASRILPVKRVGKLTTGKIQRRPPLLGKACGSPNLTEANAPAEWAISFGKILVQWLIRWCFHLGKRPA